MGPTAADDIEPDPLLVRNRTKCTAFPNVAPHMGAHMGESDPCANRTTMHGSVSERLCKHNSTATSVSRYRSAGSTCSIGSTTREKASGKRCKRSQTPTTDVPAHRGVEKIADKRAPIYSFALLRLVRHDLRTDRTRKCRAGYFTCGASAQPYAPVPSHEAMGNTRAKRLPAHSRRQSASAAKPSVNFVPAS